MIVVKMQGGLGNQLFCYAFAKALEQKGYDVKIDTSVFQFNKIDKYECDKYDIDLKISSQEDNKKVFNNSVIAKVLKRVGIDISKKIYEKNQLFDEALLNCRDNSYVEGFFQCENYFKNIREILLQQIRINRPLSEYTQDIKKQIISSRNSCSIHVRRGDMANNINIKIHGVCSLEYYKAAISFLETKLGKMNYFIFSDDIAWCKNNLKIKNATFVHSTENRIAHEDIFLMSLCEHNIIANSTFSWWGAWLNSNTHKICLAPKKWYESIELQLNAKDIIPKEWVRI